MTSQYGCYFIDNRLLYFFSPVVSREAMQEEKKRKEREEKELAARLKYAQKIEAERLRKEDADQLIRSLEQQEQDLIQRLKKAQEKQQEVPSLSIKTISFSSFLLLSLSIYSLINTSLFVLLCLCVVCCCCCCCCFRPMSSYNKRSNHDRQSVSRIYS